MRTRFRARCRGGSPGSNDRSCPPGRRSSCTLLPDPFLAVLLSPPCPADEHDFEHEREAGPRGHLSGGRLLLAGRYVDRPPVGERPLVAALAAAAVPHRESDRDERALLEADLALAAQAPLEDHRPLAFVVMARRSEVTRALQLDAVATV